MALTVYNNEDQISSSLLKMQLKFLSLKYILALKKYTGSTELSKTIVTRHIRDTTYINFKDLI